MSYMAEVYLFSKFQIPTTAKMAPMGEVGGGARLGIHSSRPGTATPRYPQRTLNVERAAGGTYGHNVVISPGLEEYPSPRHAANTRHISERK